MTMIEIIEEIIGIELGSTCYDDLIIAGALLLGFTSILLFIYVCKSIFSIFM